MGMRLNSVVIWASSNFNWLWVGLAGRIKRDTGAEIHFTGFYPSGTKFWTDQDKNGAIDTFTDVNKLFFEYDTCNEPAESVYKKARYYEEKYGMFLADVLQSDRHLGRGFSAAGVGHPRSKLSEKADYLKSAHMFNKVCAFWEDYFEKVKPDIILEFASGIVGKPFVAIARAKNIPVRKLAHSRYQVYYYWAVDEYDSWPEVKEVFMTMKDTSNVRDDELDTIRRHPPGENDYLKWNQYKSRIFFIKQSLRQIRKYCAKKIKNIVKAGNYSLKDNIAYIYSMHSKLRDMERFTTVTPEELQDMSYILYPLQEEPETALSLLSPEFNEQLALIEFISKNLPAGTSLVVKEHIFAVGRRPADFYSTITAIPNAKMYSVFGYASDAARHAKGVAVITSSAGLEAALLGIPVIAFGMHNSFSVIPHVHTVKSWNELRPLLEKICGNDTEDARNKRKEDGKRFLSALKRLAIDMSHIADHRSKKRKPASEREVEILYAPLMKSLWRKHV